MERDTFHPNVGLGVIAPIYEGYDVQSLHDALFCIFNRPEPVTHTVAQEPVLLEERIAYIEAQVQSGEIFKLCLTVKATTGAHGHGGHVYGHFRTDAPAKN